MSRNSGLSAAVLLLSYLIGGAASAHAWAFYWSKIEVQTSSWNNCMSFAEGAARERSLAQIRRDRLGVYGTANGASATMTCIGTGGNLRAMAVVMVVGDADGPVRQLRDQLVAALKRQQRVDDHD